MPSYLHEGIVQLFRCRPSLASDLLQSALHAESPRHTAVSVCVADLTELRPVEYRADLVLQLVDSAGRPVLGIIVEVQLSRDPKKKKAWPTYVASLHSRLGCPVRLLVVTQNRSVATWAAQPINVSDGYTLTPFVLGPSDVPMIDDAEQARAVPELAVLSAIVHGRDRDVARSARIAAVAICVSDNLDTERSGLFYDLICKSLGEGARRALVKMLPANYQYQTAFARKYYGQGKAEGRAEGRAEGWREMLIEQLGMRFGPLNQAALSRMAAASNVELKAIAGRVLSASSLEDALGAPGKCARKKKRE